MSAATWQALTWEIARTGGLVAYALLLASVAIGLTLSLRWRSMHYPRFVTNELHRFVTLLALVFTGIHTVAVIVDPFIKFTLPEILVPLVSHYRPIWMALGIVAAYVLIAVYLSERVRSRVGYEWWRRFHALAFVAYGFATVHGLGTGSDSRAPWAIALYVGGVLLVGALLSLRLWPTDARLARHPFVAVGSIAVLAVTVLWAASGPLAPGWNAVAGGTSGPGTALAADAAATPDASPTPSPTPVAAIALPMQATLSGTAVQDASNTVMIQATFDGQAQGSLHVSIPLSNDAATAPLTMVVQPTGATCQGALTFARGDVLGGTCTLADGKSLSLQMRVRLDQGGNLTGQLVVASGSGGTGLPFFGGGDDGG